MTSERFRKEIDGIVQELYRFNLSVMYNHSIFDPKSGRLSWVRLSSKPVIDDFDDFKLQHYLNWVERSDYTFMIFDGSIVQISYQFDDNVVSGHRLCYIPNPIIGNDGIGESDSHYAGGAWESSIETALDVLVNDPFSVGLRSMVRFDFDPKNAKKGHPASHFTINSVDCRIPCVDSMTPSNFVDFIYSNFYPKVREKYATFFDNLSSWTREKPLFTEDERRAIHVNWGDRPLGA